MLHHFLAHHLEIAALRINKDGQLREHKYVWMIEVFVYAKKILDYKISSHGWACA